MRLNILSDLHLSRGTIDLPITDADLVIVAGDLGRPEQAVAWASGFDKPVLFVPGNHEFYGGELASTVAELRQRCVGTSIHLLDNDELIIEGVRFLGTTLWTDFMLFGEGEKRQAAIDEAQGFMRDFSRIRTGESPQALFSPAACAGLFDRDARWLAARLAAPHEGPTVVITHHAPSARSIHPRFEGSLLNACFVSNAEHLVERSRVQLWVHGHTHDSFDYLLNGTRVLCNPRGYATDGVNENASFNPTLVVEID